MRWLIAFGLVASILSSARIASAQDDARATRIKTGLESKFYVSGQPHETYSLAARMKHYRVAAVSIAVIDKYRVAWTYATGLRDVASGLPATTETLFQAASMSKAVAAAGILRLFEVKNLNLDADVNTMLRTWQVPASPEARGASVTMRRLLSHTAGTNVHGFAGYDRDAPLPTLVQVLNGEPPANSERVRVTVEPGTVTEYSGGGTSIAQQLAVDVSGEPFPAFMQQTLLGPLGMTESTFDQPLPEPLWPRAADGYYSDGKPVHRGWHVYPTMAAAGLWTTPADLATFVIAIQNALRGQGRAPIDATVARQMTTKVSQTFGLGPEVEPGYFSHNGANEGFQGVFYGLDDGGKGVVVMTNSDIGLQIAEEVVHSVAKAYAWPYLQPQPKRAIPLTSAMAQEVAGKYTGNLGSDKLTLDVTAAERNGKPELLLHSVLDGGVPVRLYVESPLHLFTLTGASLTFARGDTGGATSVEVAGAKFSRSP